MQRRRSRRCPRCAAIRARRIASDAADANADMSPHAWTALGIAGHVVRVLQVASQRRYRISWRGVRLCGRRRACSAAPRRCIARIAVRAGPRADVTCRCVQKPLRPADQRAVSCRQHVIGRQIEPIAEAATSARASLHLAWPEAARCRCRAPAKRRSRRVPACGGGVICMLRRAQHTRLIPAARAHAPLSHMHVREPWRGRVIDLHALHRRRIWPGPPLVEGATQTLEWAACAQRCSPLALFLAARRARREHKPQCRADGLPQLLRGRPQRWHWDAVLPRRLVAAAASRRAVALWPRRRCWPCCCWRRTRASRWRRLRRCRACQRQGRSLRSQPRAAAR